MKKRLGAQLSLGFALIILATVAVISIVSNLLITVEFENYIEKQQREFSAQLAEGLAAQYDKESGVWNEDYIHGMGMYALNDGYILKVYDNQNVPVWDAENHDMEQCHQIMQEIEQRMSSLAGGKGQFVTHSYDIVSEEEVIGRADITYYTPYYFNENAFNFVDSLNKILLVIGIAATVAAICLGIIFAKRITRPIVKVTEVADKISQGDYSVRAEGKIGTVELKELSLAINNMAEQIEIQETLRKQLTSDVAHELRTPISGISAQLEMILDGVFKPSEERLNGIFDEVNRLSVLVSDLEKLQQIENNVLERTETDLLDLAKSAVNLFEAEINKNGLTCSVSGNSVKLLADERKIQQVIINLLSNAVKYSRKGGAIEISVNDDGNSAVLSVRDFGIGISEEDQKLIFERFYRTDKSRNRKTGGVGIGLTIASEIVKAHSGKIEVESSEGNGSIFTVTIPKS